MWLTEYATAAGRREFRLRYLKLYKESGSPARHSLAVATETQDGHVLWNFMPMSRARDINRQRVGELAPWGRRAMRAVSIST